MEARRGLSVAVGVVLGVIAGQVLGLVATGLWLTFEYEPEASDAFPGLAPAGDGPLVQDVHRWLGQLLILTLVAAAVLVAVSLLQRPSGHRWRVALLPLAWLAAVVASFTGFELAWDQLALREVTVGRGVDGYDWLWRDGPPVAFVIVRGTEVGTATIGRLLAAHLVASAVVALALGLLAYRPRRSAGGGPNRPSA